MIDTRVAKRAETERDFDLNRLPANIFSLGKAKLSPFMERRGGRRYHTVSRFSGKAPRGRFVWAVWIVSRYVDRITPTLTSFPFVL